MKEQSTRNFILFAAVCTFVTVLTNLLIHFIDFPQSTFEETVLLYKNRAYLAFNWIILFHCLMVLISMLGFGLLLDRYSRPMAILGFLFVFVFVITEWQRTLNVLWYLNGLRARYDVMTDETLKQWLGLELRNVSYQSNVQFLLFVAMFGLGNFVNGICLVLQKEWPRWLGVGLLAWSVCSALAFVADFYPSDLVNTIVDINNKYYQPLVRLMIGIWMVSCYRNLGSENSL